MDDQITETFKPGASPDTWVRTSSVFDVKHSGGDELNSHVEHNGIGVPVIPGQTRDHKFDLESKTTFHLNQKGNDQLFDYDFAVEARSLKEGRLGVDSRDDATHHRTMGARTTRPVHRRTEAGRHVRRVQAVGPAVLRLDAGVPNLPVGRDEDGHDQRQPERLHGKPRAEPPPVL